MLDEKDKDHSHGRLKFKAGETIIKQGEAGRAAYIIEQGRVEIMVKTAEGPEQSVGTRGTGTMIGEMALIDNAPRTATIKALEDCVLLEITQSDFARRLDSLDPVLQMAMKVITARYRDMLARSNIIQKSIQWPPPEIVELSYAGTTEAVEDVKMANAFKEALDNGELYLHYQPLIDLDTDKTVGFEALMRWNHPVQGFISPGVFIPIAEETGLIVEATQWAMDEACAALKRIQKSANNQNLYMSVNFSGHDFKVEGFIESIETVLTKHNLLPSEIQLEITERLLMDQPENARKTLEACRSSGMKIAIDDFGTGYSSLSYLQYFPIDVLKIDRMFVKDMMQNDSSMALIKSVIALGKNMHMKVLAEGVEEAAEAKALKDMGCDFVQGYYFARPMTEDDVVAFLKG